MGELTGECKDELLLSGAINASHPDHFTRVKLQIDRLKSRARSPESSGRDHRLSQLGRSRQRAESGLAPAVSDHHFNQLGI
jgi:hypothetical protein